jgi:VWFA-related protein
MRRTAGIVLPALLLGAYAVAQTPRFPAGADVVSIDVTAVDSEGRPIRDLGVADFEVEVDGRPRRVRSADFIDFERGATPAAAPGAPPATEAGKPPEAATPTAGVEPTRGRLVLIAVDRGELSVGGIRIALDALGALIERLRPADLVGVIALPNGPRLDFTADRAKVKDALDRISPDREDVIASALPLRERLDLALRSAQDRLDVLEAVLGNLAPIPGPKSLVFVSGGMTAVDSGLCVPRQDTGKLDCGPFGLSTAPSANVVTRLRRIVTKAAASRTTFYTLFVSQRGRDNIAERSYYTYLDPLADLAFRQSTVETLTSMSGGALLEVVAGADRAVARVASEMSGQYVLGLEPADGDRDGKPHGISVKVTRPGVTVRSRREFVIAEAPPPTATVAQSGAPAPAAEDASALQNPGATRSDHVRRMEDARRLLGEGDRLLESESFEDAAKAYAGAIALEPMYFMAHYGLGRARMRQKDYPAAIAAFEQARRVFEERTELVRGRRAARDAERAARVAAAQATQGTRGASGSSAGRGTADLPPIVDPGFSAATEPIPELPPGLMLALGSAYFRSGRIADAEREYRAALAAEPKLGEARINLAVVLLMTGKPAEAKEQIGLAKASGAKVPSGLEKDIDAAIEKATSN